MNSGAQLPRCYSPSETGQYQQCTAPTMLARVLSLPDDACALSTVYYEELYLQDF